MAVVGREDDLRIVAEDEPDLEIDVEAAEDGRERHDGADEELASLRDAFVEGFNARDLETVLALVSDDVECPDIVGDGPDVLAEELESIWERSPAAILTRGSLEGVPVAVGWLPDEDGGWSRAAMVCFDRDDGLINLVALPDDADALDRVQADDPTGEELDEWSDWAEWDRGEETVTRPRREG